MIADYHIHTHLCGHARGTIRELVQSAVGKGFREVGIADHLPLTYVEDRSLSMGPRDLPRYVEDVLAAREEFRGAISVKLGIEADYHPPTMDDIAGMLEAHPFDYVIGSVHVLGDWIFDDPRTIHKYDGLDLDAFYVEYLEAETEMARTGLYDIIGHADLAKKFDNRASIDLAPHYRELLREAGRAGMCYEVNTAGLRWPAGEVYPEQAFVRIGAEMGVPVTLGSDSHCPEDVGRDFDVALEIIRGAGYRELATFAERRMTLVPLDEA